MSFDNEKILDIIKPEATPEHFKLLPCPFCGSEEVVYIKYQHARAMRSSARRLETYGTGGQHDGFNLLRQAL